MVKMGNFLEKRTFYELMTKKWSSEFFAWKIESFSWNFFGWNRKFLWPDPRPPNFKPDWRRGLHA